VYNQYEEFEAAVRPLWNGITATKPSGYTLRDYTVEVPDAWALYPNTRDSLLKKQLLGETKMRTDVGLMQNFGTASGTRTTAERGTLFDDSKTRIPTKSLTAKVGKGMTDDILRKRSVLNDGWWWTSKNDAWVMGCGHGLKVMQLSSEGLAQLSDLEGDGLAGHRTNKKAAPWGAAVRVWPGRQQAHGRCRKLPQ
jgi:hypothetical protein